MKRSTTKVLSVYLSVLTALCVLPFGGFTASAEKAGYYTYSVNDGKATITDVDESISGDVVIPDTLGGYSVTRIGGSAFSQCKSLTSISISDSVTSIGESAFFRCSSLTSITIPDSVMSIDSSAFYGCSSLTSITIPDGVTSIGNSVFNGCSSLTSVTISNSVISIGDYAFYYCSSLTCITIPDSVTSIGNTVFLGCGSLTSITISDSVTSIGDHTFSQCSSLTSVTIPDSVTSIGDDAFYGCSSLTSVTIPDGVTSIGGYAFSYTPWYNNQPDGVVYAGKVAYKYKGEMPENTVVVLTDDTKGIAGSAFYGCSSLASITIPNSVTSIGDDAFSYCSSLTSVTIPDSVTSIGESAFGNCSSLTSVTIPNSVTSIGDYAFSGCRSLTSITIPNGVTIIGNYAFNNCSSLTSITVDEANDKYSSDSFGALFNKDKTTLIKYPAGNSRTSYTIPDGVTSIGDSAFAPCDHLISIIIPNSVTSIGDSAFSRCSSLRSITIPDSVTIIGGYAFSDTPWYYNKPDGLVYAGKVAYEYKGEMPENTVVVLADDTKGIAVGAFDYRSSLTSITIPDSVTNIGERAFYCCSSLTGINVPDSVTYIGIAAFSNCSSLTSVTIPNSVASIAPYAFSDCRSLRSVTVPAGVTEIGECAFGYYYGSDGGLTKVDNFTISGKTGSAAEKYAKDNGFTFTDSSSDEIVSKTVTGLKAASITSTSIKLTWDKTEGATGYLVYKYNAETKKYEAFKRSATNSLTVTSLPSNSAVYFRVRPYKTVGGKNIFGITSGFLRTYTAPAKVTGLKISAYSNTSLRLTWAKTAGATGYRVYKYNAQTKKYEGYRNVKENTLTVAGLSSGAVCYFKVRAYRALGGVNYWGDISDFLKTATRPANTTVKLSSGSAGKMTVAITRSAEATGYLIQYSTNKNMSGATSRYTTSLKPTYSGLARAKTYYVRVRPYVLVGSTRIFSPAYSAVAVVKIK